MRETKLFIWIVLASCWVTICFGQELVELAPLPEKLSNNAVAGGVVNDVAHVYSFAGIDSTKLFSGIHKRAYRYNTELEIWDQIADLPTGEGRVAASANTVKNKIYIIGGYEVFSNGSESSFNNVHIYDPELNEYLPDGAPIPVPIDDQVQVTYKDSLIFVVTGWSNDTNVPNVQIYDPANDNWQVGTPVPNNNQYKVFGASGGIIGDTLYYVGGAQLGSSFPASPIFRKGYINPEDPTEIEWSSEFIIEGGRVYRPAAITSERKIYWVGGSEKTYNYNGVAYDGSGGVEPRKMISFYDQATNLSIEQYDFPMFPLMDMRSAAMIDAYNFVIAGGMTENQEVSNRVFSLKFDKTISTKDPSLNVFQVYPNPSSNSIQLTMEGRNDVQVFDNSGKLVLSHKNVGSHELIKVSSLAPGTYFIKVFDEDRHLGTDVFVVKP